MNFKAYHQKTMSTFENMFDLELLCEAGKEIPEIRKKVTAMS
jgi:hypothetical protein